MLGKLQTPLHDRCKRLLHPPVAVLDLYSQVLFRVCPYWAMGGKTRDQSRNVFLFRGRWSLQRDFLVFGL